MNSTKEPFFRELRNWRSDDAAALLEAAIVVPLLLLLIIGSVEFGRVYFAAITVANAAMAGAHAGSQNSGTADSTYIRQIARDDAGDVTLAVNTSRSCRCPDSDAVVSCSDSCGAYGSPQFFVQVTASKNVAFFFHYPGFPSVISVARSATMRVQ